jgi:RNA-directed DNA polymerase
MLKDLKPRRYAHFDDPLDKDALAKFQVTAQQVASHSFLPLLGYEKITRKMDFDEGFPALIKKPRAIRYASHTDAAIYGIYNQKLVKAYEEILSSRGLAGCILAYRSDIGNNINFAKSLFHEIKARRDCVVTCVDISRFFDNIQHDRLKQNLCAVLRINYLDNDWFKLFTRLTKYEYVTKDDLEKVLGKVKRKRICSIETFRKKVRPIVKVHLMARGIPQGTPLSGTLANVYMLDIDAQMSAYVQERGGSYRRYSDDLALVLPSSEHLGAVLGELGRLLSEHDLVLNDEKTCVTAISAGEECQYTYGDECQYLGFTYDGRQILIRSASMKNFYARMKRGLNKYIKGAAQKKVQPHQIRKRVPIGRFTHWGDNKNFVQYAYRAARIMESPAMKNQLRNHVKIFDRAWEKSMRKWYGDAA